MDAEGVSREVQSQVQKIEEINSLVHQLAKLRHAANLTQEEMAKKLGVTQSAISKLEGGNDEDLTIGQIKKYAEAAQERISIVFGKPINHVEAVKTHALGIRHHLSTLASLAHGDAAMEEAIQKFFGEAFFNILAILSKCQQQMPSNAKVEVRMELLHGDPSPRPPRASIPTRSSTRK